MNPYYFENYKSTKEVNEIKDSIKTIAIGVADEIIELIIKTDNERWRSLSLEQKKIKFFLMLQDSISALITDIFNHSVKQIEPQIEEKIKNIYKGEKNEIN